jgi:alpha-L-arabinofuranosidase
VACTVQMRDRPLEGPHNATVLAGDSPEAFNDVEHPNRVVPQRTKVSFTHGMVKLPPHSLTIVRVNL